MAEFRYFSGMRVHVCLVLSRADREHKWDNNRDNNWGKTFRFPRCSARDRRAPKSIAARTPYLDLWLIRAYLRRIPSMGYGEFHGGEGRTQACHDPDRR